ncbi:unnamed protein product [Amoebophrya sp. A25]|nr:unnamed protein product [Amoebophrya sp. A25]|eukprot:GSA25T00022168001.1
MFHTFLTGVILPTSWLLRSHLTYLWIPPVNNEEREAFAETAAEISTFLDVVEGWIPFDVWFKPLHLDNVYQLAGIQESFSSLDQLREILEAKTENVNYVPKQYLTSSLFEQSLGLVEMELTEQLTSMFATHLDCSASVKNLQSRDLISSAGPPAGSSSIIRRGGTAGSPIIHGTSILTTAQQQQTCIEKKDAILADTKILVAKNLESLLETEMYLVRHQTHAERTRLTSTTAMLEALRKQGGDLSINLTTARVRKVTKSVLQRELTRIFRNHRIFSVAVETEKCGAIYHRSSAMLKIVNAQNSLLQSFDGTSSSSSSGITSTSSTSGKNKSGSGGRRASAVQGRGKRGTVTRTLSKKQVRAYKQHVVEKEKWTSSKRKSWSSPKKKQRVEAVYEGMAQAIECRHLDHAGVANKNREMEFAETFALAEHDKRAATPVVTVSALPYLTLSLDKNYAPLPYRPHATVAYENRWVPLPLLVQKAAEHLKRVEDSYRRRRKEQLAALLKARAQQVASETAMLALFDGGAAAATTTTTRRKHPSTAAKIKEQQLLKKVLLESRSQHVDPQTFSTSVQREEQLFNVERVIICPENSLSVFTANDVVSRLIFYMREYTRYALESESQPARISSGSTTATQHYLNAEELELGRLWNRHSIKAFAYFHIKWGTCKAAKRLAEVLRNLYFEMQFRDRCKAFRIEQDELLGQHHDADSSTPNLMPSAEPEGASPPPISASSQQVYRFRYRPHNICRLPQFDENVRAERDRLDASMITRAVADAAERERARTHAKTQKYLAETRDEDPGTLNAPAPPTPTQDDDEEDDPTQEEITLEQVTQSFDAYDEFFERTFFTEDTTFEVTAATIEPAHGTTSLTTRVEPMPTTRVEQAATHSGSCAAGGADRVV